MRKRDQDTPSGFDHNLLRRVFIGLYPTKTGLDTIRQIAKNLPRSLSLEHPVDLHITLLFGGDQPENLKPFWKDAANRSMHALEPFSLLPMPGVALERHRSILALCFSGEDPFWKKASDLANHLSWNLLSFRTSKPFWPHMTLCRKISNPLTNGEDIVIQKYPLDSNPFLGGVRLWASSATGNPKNSRYTVLADFPFPQDQHGHK